MREPASCAEDRAQFFYCASGLSVTSEIALPELIPLQPDGRPDVTVRLGPVPTGLEHASASGLTWQMADGRFLLGIPGVARFLLEAGRDITVEADHDTPPEVIAIFLLGTVFGILLHQRGVHVGRFIRWVEGGNR